jgi:tetratricopeptide (TPR) repeat protein
MKSSYLLLLLLLFMVLALQIVNLTWHRSNERYPSARNPELLREYAVDLYNQKLYVQAVDAYQDYLNTRVHDADTEANIHYLIANIHMDHLREYEKAMAHYMKSRLIHPDGDLVKEINRRIVECLERMDRSREAHRELDRITAVEERDRSQYEGSTIIARIGTRDITWAEISDYIDSLPDYLQESLEVRETRLELVRQFVLTELMYEKAKRMNYESDPEITEATYQLKKNLMVQKLLSEEVLKRIRPAGDSDVELYFAAHRDKYRQPAKAEVTHLFSTDPAALEDAKTQVQDGTPVESFTGDLCANRELCRRKGDLGTVLKGKPIPFLGTSETFQRAIFETMPGQFSKTVERDDGYHLFRVREKHPPRDLPLEEVRSRVKADLENQRRAEAFEELQESMLSTRDVRIYDDLVMQNIETDG